MSLSEADDEADVAIEQVLTCLARDIERAPSPIVAFPTDLADRMVALTAGINVDPSEEIDATVAF